MLPISITLELYDIIRDWCIECNCSVSVVIDNKHKTVNIYTDKPAQMIGYHGSLIDSKNKLLKELSYYKDYTFGIFETIMIIQPSSPKISEDKYYMDLAEYFSGRGF